MSVSTKAPNRIALAAPLVIFALVAVTVGVIARQTALDKAGIVCTQTGPYTSTCTTASYFHLFFSDPIHLKVWLSTAALVLGIFQLLTAARIYDLLHFPPRGRIWNVTHRWSGRVAIALTLPVAYHCIFLLGFETLDARVFLHSMLGSAFYGAFLGKMWIVRAKGFPGWALPVAGGLLFAILLGLWLTSSLWFFTKHGVGL